jgi:hypothetical protein
MHQKRISKNYVSSVSDADQKQIVSLDDQVQRIAS